MRYIWHNLEEIGVAVLFSAMVLVVALGVFTRYVLNSPVSWTDELARFLLIYIVFLGAVVAFKEGEHIVVDLAIQYLGPRGRWVLTIAGSVFTIIVIVVVLVYGIALSIKSYIIQSSVLAIRYAYVYAIVPVSCIFILVRITEALLPRLEAWIHGNRSKPDATNPSR